MTEGQTWKLEAACETQVGNSCEFRGAASSAGSDVEATDLKANCEFRWGAMQNSQIKRQTVNSAGGDLEFTDQEANCEFCGG